MCGGWGWGDQGPSQSGYQKESEATEPPLSTLQAAGPHSDVRPSPSELLPSSKSTDLGQDSGGPCRICPPPWETKLISALGRRNTEAMKKLMPHKDNTKTQQEVEEEHMFRNMYRKKHK